MKDLQTLIAHPSVQSAETLVLASGQPVVLVKDGARKAMGQPLNNQRLLALLKASLPAEVMAGFQWGKQLGHSFQVNGGNQKAKIHLKPEKAFLIEIDMGLAAEQEEAPASLEIPLSAPVGEEVYTQGGSDYIEPNAPLTPAANIPPAPAESAAEDDEGFVREVAALTVKEATLLIYTPGQEASLQQGAEMLGYPVVNTNRADVTLEVLKYHHYPIFILQLGSNFAQDPVYRYLAGANMDNRRDQYAVLVAPGLRSGDTLLAFTLSMSLVIAPNDLGALATLIEKGITGWQRFTEPLHHYLREAGRL